MTVNWLKNSNRFHVISKAAVRPSLVASNRDREVRGAHEVAIVDRDRKGAADRRAETVRDRNRQPNIVRVVVNNGPVREDPRIGIVNPVVIKIPVLDRSGLKGKSERIIVVRMENRIRPVVRLRRTVNLALNVRT